MGIYWKSKKMKVIINADDFGKDEVTTKAIGELIESGAISSTTIMANGKCLDECLRIANAHPEVSFGIHLCLSEFASLTKSPILEKYGITDRNGDFIRLAILKKRYISKELKAALRAELCAQIEYLQSLGFNLSHADSHQHIHLHYRFAHIFDSVIEQYGFKKVRRCKPHVKNTSPRSVFQNIRKSLVDMIYVNKYITTNIFQNYDEYVKHPELYVSDTCELMCHPGHSNPRYIAETQMVANKKALKGNTLISYKQL